ncbi:MAG: hypothetical protein K0B81_08710 [Candidatus Cloacimonetes bacterium]|nr:hypothetical protein [Candidatus Cloacimonadota bacterium]
MTKFLMKIREILPSLLILLLLIASCGIFETREAEDPVGKVYWNHFPITAFQTLDNLIYAYDYNENINRYSTILSDDFEFFFDTQDIQDFNLPISWNKQMEVEMRSLIDKKIELELALIEDKDDIIQSDTAVIYRDYHLVLTRSSGTTNFIGSMTLYMQRDTDGFWRINRWEDFRKENQVTWGRLKYEFIPQ